MPGTEIVTNVVGPTTEEMKQAVEVLDRPINGVWFQTYVDQVLVPTLRKDDIVVMDMYGRPRWRKKNL